LKTTNDSLTGDTIMMCHVALVIFFKLKN